MKTVYMIECEWDIGLDDLYESKEAAMKAIEDADLKKMGLLEDGDTIESLMKNGLLKIHKRTIKE